jgi:hypothetical protein
MQQAGGFRHIVDILGRAGDVLVTGLVPLLLVHTATDAVGRNTVDALHNVHDVLLRRRA